MLNGLGIAGVFPETGVESPFFPQYDCALLVALDIPCAEDDQLVIMIDERPAPGPVTTGCAAAQDELFSVHVLLIFNSEPPFYPQILILVTTSAMLSLMYQRSPQPCNRV